MKKESTGTKVKGRTIPSNLNQCFEYLDVLLGDEDYQVIMNSNDENIMIDFHHTLGRKIRNEWGLWASDSALYKYFRDMGIKHPDDMSGIILTSYYRLKHNKPIDVQGQANEYIKYWNSINEG